MAEIMFKIALSTVGVTEVLKKYISITGTKLWTTITLLVGTGMIFVVLYCPDVVVIGIVGVSGAVIFYDTIFKCFKKLFEKMTVKENE